MFPIIQHSAAGAKGSHREASPTNEQLQGHQAWYDENYPGWFNVVRRNRKHLPVRENDGQLPNWLSRAKTQSTKVPSPSAPPSEEVASTQISPIRDAMGEMTTPIPDHSPPPEAHEMKYTFNDCPGFALTWAVRVDVMWPDCSVWLYISPYQGPGVWFLASMHYSSQQEDETVDNWVDNFHPILQWLCQSTGSGLFGFPTSMSDDHLGRFRIAIREAVLNTWDVSVAQANRE
jgi:hypothetical protein